jgi:hypothetical protein
MEEYMSGTKITTRPSLFYLIVRQLSATGRPAARGFPAKMERIITAVGGDSLATVATGLPVCVGHRAAASAGLSVVEHILSAERRNLGSG